MQTLSWRQTARLLMVGLPVLVASTVAAAQSPGLRATSTRYDRLLDPTGIGFTLDVDVNPKVDVRLAYDRIAGSALLESFCSPVIRDCPAPTRYRAEERASTWSIAVPIALAERGPLQFRVVPALGLSFVRGEQGMTQVGADIGLETRIRPGFAGRYELLAGADVGLRASNGEVFLADGPKPPDSGTIARLWVGLRFRLLKDESKDACC